MGGEEQGCSDIPQASSAARSTGTALDTDILGSGLWCDSSADLACSCFVSAKFAQPTPQRRAFNRKCGLPGKLAGLAKSQKENEEPHLSEL